MTNIAKIVSVAAAIAVCVFSSPASADEPSAIASYKAQVVKLVSKWGEDALRSAKDVSFEVNELRGLAELKEKASKPKEKLENEKNDLEKEMHGLIDNRAKAVQTLEATQKQHDNAKENTYGRGALAAVVDKYKEDVKKLDDQIKDKDIEIRKKTVAVELAGDVLKNFDKKIETANRHIAEAVGSIQSTATALSQNIKNIASPTKGDAKLADKSAKTQWGPILAQYIKDQISAEAGRRWRNIQATPQASWPQSDFAAGHPPTVTVSMTPNVHMTQ